ncbi:MAG: hypothetical protein GF409_04330 [Candidatus Omnitrophica bacterium]|nr:hypothetical protein [Candidatus Omnitrophota bacterium]
MSLENNINLIRKIEDHLSAQVPIRLGVNKKNELARLVYEICRGRSVEPEQVFIRIDLGGMVEKGKNGLFRRIKKALLKLRYPSMREGDDPHIMPFTVDKPVPEPEAWDFRILPEKIYVERSVESVEWTGSFLSRFPEASVDIIDDPGQILSSFTGKSQVELYNERSRRILVTKNRSGYVKPCPCTKNVHRCGYNILNLGFGCPMDCSYCYLQMYSNSPWLVFQANVDDYRAPIEDFDARVGRRTRIGTGEFTDSLYLDKYTSYSSYLIPLFRQMRNLVLELKTKTVDIENVLRHEPHDNVVVSWSINTRKMARKYEKGASSIDERIRAASRAAARGFKVGFHFDPIIYYEGWEDEYRQTVEELFSNRDILENTEWMSLGTLRYTPGLKQVAEQRFGENRMYYAGEFFLGADGKLRYPARLRSLMYNKMIEWIRAYPTSAWIYLCMEPDEIWGDTLLEKSDYSYGAKIRG